MNKPSNLFEIKTQLFCSLCRTECGQDQDMEEYARIIVGYTPEGLQVWCTRHSMNVIHISFENQQLPSNTLARYPVPK